MSSRTLLGCIELGLLAGIAVLTFAATAGSQAATGVSRFAADPPGAARKAGCPGERSEHALSNLDSAGQSRRGCHKPCLRVPPGDERGLGCRGIAGRGGRSTLRTYFRTGPTREHRSPCQQSRDGGFVRDEGNLLPLHFFGSWAGGRCAGRGRIRRACRNDGAGMDRNHDAVESWHLLLRGLRGPRRTGGELGQQLLPRCARRGRGEGPRRW